MTNLQKFDIIYEVVLIKEHITHGFSKTEKLYNVWKSMRQRCLNKNNDDYSHYGGRGITICQDWLDSYIPFREWALANGYQDGLTIDRIDYNGNYCPENCRWITQHDQNRNRTNNRYITYNGVTKTMTDWAEEYNINLRTLKSRLDAGCDIEDALTRPILGHNK